MALSNIFREPQREITESVVGIAILGALGYGDFLFARWLLLVTQDQRGPLSCETCAMIVFMLLGILGGAIFVIVIVVTHDFGDFVCNKLQEVGIHLRPRQRK